MRRESFDSMTDSLVQGMTVNDCLTDSMTISLTQWWTVALKPLLTQWLSCHGPSIDSMSYCLIDSMMDCHVNAITDLLTYLIDYPIDSMTSCLNNRLSLNSMWMIESHWLNDSLSFWGNHLLSSWMGDFLIDPYTNGLYLWLIQLSLCETMAITTVTAKCSNWIALHSSIWWSILTLWLTNLLTLLSQWLTITLCCALTDFLNFCP